MIDHFDKKSKFEPKYTKKRRRRIIRVSWSHEMKEEVCWFLGRLSTSFNGLDVKKEKKMFSESSAQTITSLKYFFINYHPVHNTNDIHMLTDLFDVSKITKHYSVNAQHLEFPDFIRQIQTRN
ncbi:CLUMA_CG013047, isoform A [Clunio marinus]|uniref:CLUMA_CG013047, isoform A n=1 Tax=Clunio marinus TaxID=568069 RepID=A0A1J1IMH1_9DIPT|nr:CLUMA_CG013047, isoform A [Clunio marinus]